MTRTGKFLGLIALFGALIGGFSVSSSVAQASTLPAMKISQLSYQSATKTLSFKATTKASISKVAVAYNGKTTYYPAKKNGTAITYTFSGNHNFKIYGTTSKNGRLTKAATISNQQYGTTDPLNYNENRSETTFTLNVTTLGANRTVCLYGGDKLLATKTTGTSGKATFTLTSAEYAKYGKQLGYTVQAKNRKTAAKIGVTYMPHASDIAFNAVA